MVSANDQLHTLCPQTRKSHRWVTEIEMEAECEDGCGPDREYS